MSETGRSLPPTPRKMREARRRGDVPRARDLTAAACVVAVGAALVLGLPASTTRLGALASDAFSRTPSRLEPSIQGIVPAALEALASLTVLPLVVGFGAVLLAGMLYTGPSPSWHAVSPRLDRLSPSAGLRRMLSAERWLDSARDLAKLALIVLLSAVGVTAAIRPSLACPSLPPDAGAPVLAHCLVRLAAVLGVGACVIAIVDAAWSRHAWLRRLRMTPDELRRELRETEGDPSLRGRRRRLHREIAEHRMIDEVRRATVIVTNPTHIAVALRWDEATMDAPAVVASGSRLLARRIVREARRSGVPVVRDTGLARSLAGLEEGETIPEELYRAVAAVLRALDEGGEREQG